MRQVCLGLALSLIAMTAAHAGGPDGEAEAADPVQQQITNYYHDLYAQKYDAALADIKDLNPDPANRDGRALVSAMRAAALLGSKREVEAQKLIAEVRQIAPMDPAADSALFGGSLISNHFDVAADAFDDMIARFPDAAREEDWDSLRYFLSHQPKGEDRRNEDRRIALARIGYGGDTAIGYGTAANAVDILVDRKDFASASDLLQYVNDPELVENMLVLRRYAPLWPRLGQLAGPHLSNVVAASVASAERAYQAAPDDHDKLQQYANALRLAGRLSDAIALKPRLPSTPAAMAASDEMMGWAVNNIAYALHEAGKSDEADQLFAVLNDAPMKNAGWRISMIINRTEMLVSSGKFEQAAQLLDATEASAKTDGTPYAKQLVRRLKYCVYSSLHRNQEAAQALPDMLAHADDALQATIDALLCGGEKAKAEELVIHGLNETDKAKRENFEREFVRSLQPVPLADDDPSVWRKSWKSLLERPEIAAAYARLGRDLPPELLPVQTK